MGFAGSATAGGSSLTVVEYQVDGGAWASATGLASWSFTASSLTEGAHTVNVRATAASGRTGCFRHPSGDRQTRDLIRKTIT